MEIGKEIIGCIIRNIKNQNNDDSLLELINSFELRKELSKL